MGPRGNVQSRRRFFFLKDWNLRIIFIRLLDRCSLFHPLVRVKIDTVLLCLVVYML